MITATVILTNGKKISGEQTNPSPEGVFIDGVFYAWNDFKLYTDSLSCAAEVAKLESALTKIVAHLLRNKYRYAAAAASAASTAAYFLFA
jgi:hypothetical protein